MYHKKKKKIYIGNPLPVCADCVKFGFGLCHKHTSLPLRNNFKKILDKKK